MKCSDFQSTSTTTTVVSCERKWNYFAFYYTFHKIHVCFFSWYGILTLHTIYFRKIEGTGFFQKQKRWTGHFTGRNSWTAKFKKQAFKWGKDENLAFVIFLAWLKPRQKIAHMPLGQTAGTFPGFLYLKPAGSISASLDGMLVHYRVQTNSVMTKSGFKPLPWDLRPNSPWCLLIKIQWKLNEKGGSKTCTSYILNFSCAVLSCKYSLSFWKYLTYEIDRPT